MLMDPRVLLISPVRNEAPHFELVARAVAAQTVLPARWIVVDDGSDDGTYELAGSLAEEIAFMTVISTAESADVDVAVDRLAKAAAPRTFNRGLRGVDWKHFTHIGKLDGDIELPPDYLQRVITEFSKDGSLGLAGGQLVERFGPSWKRIRIPGSHVHGALKLYSRECFEAIGGIQERLGWDTIDGVYARMNGFTTRSFPEILARHHRHWGSTGGTLRGRARHGTCAYIARYTPTWVVLRSAKLATVRPYGLSGGAFLYGYLHAALSRTDRVDDERFRRFVRRELRQRMLRPLTTRLH
jgi:glycosyltransferase involved in cell wall biosynthesis